MYWIEFGWAFLQFTFKKSAPYCWYGLFCVLNDISSKHIFMLLLWRMKKKSKINLIYISMWMHSERNAHNYIISHISISLILGKNRVFLAWMIARHFKITIFASHLCVYPKCNAVKCRPKHTLYLRSDFETKTIRSTQRFILSNSKSAEFQLWANKIRPERERVLLY